MIMNDFIGTQTHNLMPKEVANNVPSDIQKIHHPLVSS